jgi:hypothetical protein
MHIEQTPAIRLHRLLPREASCRDWETRGDKRIEVFMP